MSDGTFSSSGIGSQQITELQEKIDAVLAEARSQGAQASEAMGQYVIRRDASTLDQAPTARSGQVFLGLVVYRDQQRGEVSVDPTTADFNVTAMVKSALDVAASTAADASVGLADADTLASEYPELGLYHDTEVTTAQLREYVDVCEQAGFASDQRISDSKGTALTVEHGCRVHANSHGFEGHYAWSEHALTCHLRAAAQGESRIGSFQETQRSLHSLTDYAEAGRLAASRAISYLGGKPVAAGCHAALFAPEAAQWLLAGLIQAITGKSLAGEGTFLQGQLGQPLFAAGMGVAENPHAFAGLGSVPYDADGVAVTARSFVEDGRLVAYALDAQSARKLGLGNTGNAFATPFEIARNLSFAPGALDQAALRRQMDRGVFVVQARPPSLDLRTGVFSQRAIGYEIEGGEVQQILAPFTLTGNLRDVFRQILAVGNDAPPVGRITSASVLVEGIDIG